MEMTINKMLLLTHAISILRIGSLPTTLQIFLLTYASTILYATLLRNAF